MYFVIHSSYCKGSRRIIVPPRGVVRPLLDVASRIQSKFYLNYKINTEYSVNILELMKTDNK